MGNSSARLPLSCAPPAALRATPRVGAALAFGATLVGTGLAFWLLWLPFGLSLPDRLEGWGILQVIERGQPSIMLDSDRALRFLPWVVGYAMVHDSFVGVNLVMIACLVVKALSLYGLLCLLLPAHRVCAAAGAFLVALYPVDLALTDSRAVNVQLSAALYLAGAWLFALSWRWRSAWLLAAAVPFVVVSLEIYEAAYALVAVTPAVLFWLRPGSARRAATGIAVWYLAPAITLLHLAAVRLTQPLAYQEGLLRGGMAAPDALWQMVSSVGNAYRAHLWLGWLDAARAISPDDPVIGYAALVALLGLAVMVLQRPGDDNGHVARSHRSIGLLAVAGVALIGIGFAPYVPTVLRWTTTRVFIFSSIGAAVFVAAALAWITTPLPRFGAIVRVLVATALIFVSAHFALRQQTSLSVASDQQREVLVELTRLVPTLPDDGALLLFDETADNRIGYAFYDGYIFRNSVQFVYKNYNVMAWMCHPKVPDWYGDRQFCRAGPDTVTLGSTDFSQTWDYKRVLMLRYTDEWGLEPVRTLPSNPATDASPAGYAPDAWLGRTDPPPPRVQTALGFPKVVERPSPVRMVRAGDLRLGAGWFVADGLGQDVWRGVVDDAEITVLPGGAPSRRLTLELAPGVGLGNQPFTLNVVAEDGGSLARHAVAGRGIVQVDVPTRADAATRVRLRVDGEHPPAAAPIANFNVFQLY